MGASTDTVDDDRFATLMARVDALLEEGRAGDARSRLRAYVGQEPEDPRFPLRLAELHASVGEELEAARYRLVGLSGAAEHQGAIASLLGSSASPKQLDDLTREARSRASTVEQLPPAVREAYGRLGRTPEVSGPRTKSAADGKGAFLMDVFMIGLLVGPWLVGAYVLGRALFRMLAGPAN